ncbi:hypothetical protein ASG22_16270 [Chryseobacterium sp. Leaf405]|uniref:hypothetical protein n=1 Tax=Chryseobacterium sp. Leaf405 TaxID=1736367 RepID=UPI0006F47BD7|nr:hypothetical protein [Chryseobacterium sp. Leaf405]KQT20971.1 hypothetical protein ASG22_16270 [Chryseobacterium sp. Leaf405]
MKLNIYYSLALLVFLSCTPDGKKEKAVLSEKVGHKVPVKKKFDLFNITFKETLKDAGLNVKEDRQSAETLEGYGTFVSSSPYILIFDHQSLYGKNATDQNQLVMHYSLNEKVISAIELHMYTSDALKKVDSVLINKFGEPGFTDSYSKHPGLAIDKNGTMMDGPRADITYQVWKNTKTGISYHLLRNMGSHGLRFAELTVINDKGSDADSWIRFKNYDKYPKKFN